jgi:putative ABC transport system permease protein
VSLLRLAWRESRTARRKLLMYMSSISLGVAALVAIDSFSANTTRSIHEQARAMMGGDIAFTGRGLAGDSVHAILDSLRGAGVPVEQSTSFASMAIATRTGNTRLVQVRAISSGYPIYGDVITRPMGVWRELPRTDIALVDPSLLIALNVSIGDTLSIGFAKFVIAGAIESIPGDPGVAAIVGPRVFINERWLDKTGLLGFGSRAEYEAVARVPRHIPPGRWVLPLRARLERQQVRIRTVGESETALASGVTELTRFLSIVGLVALLLGGIGVASGVHAFVQRKIDVVAILRCLGATGWQVLAVYVAQAAAMGFVGAAAGALLGIGMQFTLPKLIGDFLPVDVNVVFEPRAVAYGLGIGVWVALVFALRPLLAVRRVSPLVTLRRDAETMGAAQRHDLLGWFVTIALTLSVIALAFSRAETTQDGFVFTVGIAASLAVLASSACLLTKLAKRAGRWRWPYVARQGLANLHRPANQTQSVVIALGFGAFLVSTLYLVQANLLQRFEITAGASRGNVLFFDVQDDQLAGIDSIIRHGGHEILESAPLVSMRISAIKGAPITEYARTSGLGSNHWALRREYRSTYRDTSVATETITAGHWFSGVAPRDSVYEVSLENDLASTLKVRIGDEITWDVEGRPVRTRVTSLREVNWGRFEPNFFAVFPRAALESAPKQHIIVASVASDSAIAVLQRASVTKYPNVASIDLTLIRATILKIVDRVSSAVRFLALFSFAMGIPVLFSAVSATRRDRLRESVLLKTLGATRRQVARILFTEYAALGLLGAAAGMLLSMAGAWALMKWVFETTFSPAAVPAIVIALIMMSMAVGIGALTSREVFRATAMDALRD